MKNAIVVARLDVVQLYEAFQNLCAIEAKPREINNAISAGMRQCPGLRIWKETQTGVRV